MCLNRLQKTGGGKMDDLSTYQENGAKMFMERYGNG